ncbi:MAG: ammonium transporter [Deltaproteobacteria bacterium]|nr:MAG: ammonium transporter [Deltaproteobacteria bacterium]
MRRRGNREKTKVDQLTAVQGAVSAGDTAWVLVSSALVLLMTPGLALFYGGMVRSKNLLATLMHSFFAMGLVTVQWVVIGYSLAFAPGNALVGGLDFAFLHGVGSAPASPDATIPHSVFMIFQGMFAIITPALISGAFAERIKFRAYVLFVLLWATLVYDPVCHWVWGPRGWLGADGRGALDFAGGTVVHINSGVAALAFVFVLGRRIGYPHQAMKPHNLGLTLLGAGLLWFGWFGFNAGSALAADGAAANAFVVTHVAAAAATLSWALVEAMHRGTASVLGAVSGAVAGLVAITPACGFVGPGAALAIGAGAGVFCYGGVLLKARLGYDDALDAFGVHGIGGTWGALATGLFASAAIGGTAGLFESGTLGQTGVQLLSIAATAVYSFVVTLVLAYVLDATVGLRVTEEEERTGLDLSAHGEAAYDF